MTQKRMREFARLVERDGDVELLRHGVEGTRYAFYCKAPNGREHRFNLGAGSNDHHADKNELARIKRWARENPATTIGAALQKAAAIDVPVIDKSTGQPVPMPTEKPVMTQATKPREMNRIGQANFFRLCTMMQKMDMAGLYTLTALAERCGKEMGLEIATSTIAEALEVTELALPAAPPVPPRAPARNEIVARELVALLRELGKEVAPDLLAVAQRTSIPERKA